MNYKYENLDRLIYILIGALLAVVFELASRARINVSGDGIWHGLNYNLLVYALALIGAFVLFCVLAWLVERLRRKKEGASPAAAGRGAVRMQRAVLYGFYTIAAAALIALICRIYVNECNLYPGNAAPTYLRQELPHRFYLAAIAALAGSLFFTLPRLRRDTVRNRPFRVTTALIWAVLNGIAVYCPNIFQDQGGGLIHIHAVTNSIVNVARLQPYSAYNCSIYGHYGLLCLPFVKLLGGDLYAVMQTLALMAFFAFLAAFYVADRLIRHDAVYLMAVAGITGTTTILTRHGQYFQINPLRLLFPCLTMAVVAFGAAHRTKSARVLTAVLAAACGVGSVIWNLETGLFCVAVFLLTWLFRGFYEERVFTYATLRRILTALAAGAGCVAAAYGIVCLYNRLTGGESGTFRLFIYPFFSGTYHVDHLRVPLPSTAYLYFFQILLFFLTVAGMLRRQYLLRANVITGDPNAVEGVDFGAMEAADTLRVAIALSGLSSLTYFMNRAAYGNMSISHIQMCLLLAAFGEGSLALSKESRRRLLGTPAAYLNTAVSAVLFGGCVWMAVEGALYLPVSYDFRANSSWKTASMNEGIEAIRSSIPMDTYAFGTYIPEVYLQLGWNTGCVMTDWSDINDLNRTFAFRGAMKHNRVLTTEVDAFAAYSKGVYAPTTKVSVDGITFQLFERIDPIDENAAAAGDLKGAAEGTLVPEGTDSGAVSAAESVSQSSSPDAESVLSSGTEEKESEKADGTSSDSRRNKDRASSGSSGTDGRKAGQRSSGSARVSLAPLPSGRNAIRV